MMKQLKKWVTAPVLETIFKSFVRPNLDYCDVVYHKANISSNIFASKNSKPILGKIESIQYTAARVITGAWKGSNMLKLYETLGWESMNNRRELRRLVLLFEIMETKSPKYLFDTIVKQQTKFKALRKKKIY